MNNEPKLVDDAKLRTIREESNGFQQIANGPPFKTLD
jgi:hypothetical protein